MLQYFYPLTYPEAKGILEASLRDENSLPMEMRGAIKVLLDRVRWIEERESKDYPYPFNLLYNAYGEPESGMGVLDKDQLAGLEYVLSELEKTHPKVALALDLHYKQGMSYVEIGRRFGVSGSAISGSYIKKGMRILRHPSRYEYIKRGYKAFSGDLYKKEYARHEEEIQRAKDAARERLHMYTENVDEVIQQIEDAAKSSGPDDPRKLDVRDLGLPTMTVNALYRRDVRTVDDILRHNEKEIMKFRSMGKKGFTEICFLLHTLGFDRFNDGSLIP